MSHFRLDRIRNIKITDTAVKDSRLVTGLENGLDLPKHMAEHVYMFSGKSQRVTFKINRGMVGEVIDWFGAKVTFSDENESENSVIATVRTNLEAMRYWALQYAPHVTVLSPSELRDKIKKDLMSSLDNYSKEV